MFVGNEYLEAALTDGALVYRVLGIEAEDALVNLDEEAEGDINLPLATEVCLEFMELDILSLR